MKKLQWIQQLTSFLHHSDPLDIWVGKILWRLAGYGQLRVLMNLNLSIFHCLLLPCQSGSSKWVFSYSIYLILFTCLIDQSQNFLNITRYCMFIMPIAHSHIFHPGNHWCTVVLNLEAVDFLWNVESSTSTVIYTTMLFKIQQVYKTEQISL